MRLGEGTGEIRGETSDRLAGLDRLYTGRVGGGEGGQLVFVFLFLNKNKRFTNPQET